MIFVITANFCLGLVIPAATIFSSQSLSVATLSSTLQHPMLSKDFGARRHAVEMKTSLWGLLLILYEAGIPGLLPLLPSAAVLLLPFLWLACFDEGGGGCCPHAQSSTLAGLGSSRNVLTEVFMRSLSQVMSGWLDAVSFNDHGLRLTEHEILVAPIRPLIFTLYRG